MASEQHIHLPYLFTWKLLPPLGNDDDEDDCALALVDGGGSSPTVGKPRYAHNTGTYVCTVYLGTNLKLLLQVHTVQGKACIAYVIIQLLHIMLYHILSANTLFVRCNLLYNSKHNDTYSAMQCSCSGSSKQLTAWDCVQAQGKKQMEIMQHPSWGLSLYFICHCWPMLTSKVVYVKVLHKYQATY